MSASVNASSLEWREFALGDLLSFSNGINADKSAYGAGVPFANVLEVITNESITAPDIPGRITVGPKVLRRYEVQPGDVLFNRTSETQEEVGLASVYVGNEPIVFGGFVFRGRPLTSELTLAYSKYAFRSPTVRSQIIARGQGGIRANIGQRDLKSVTIRLPSRTEQTAIAEVLDNVSELISRLERMIAKKQAIKQGMMQQLLTGRIRLPGFDGCWVTVTYRDLVHIERGGVFKASEAAPGPVPVIAAGRLPAAFTDRSNRAAPVVTISASGASAGFVAYHLRPIFASDCSTISPNPRVDLSFIYYGLQLRQEQIYRAQAGGAQPHVHAKDVYPLAVDVPPSIAEQRAIAATLRDVDSEITALEHRLDKARHIKTGAMQELLTGRTRLPAEEGAA